MRAAPLRGLALTLCTLCSATAADATPDTPSAGAPSDPDRVVIARVVRAHVTELRRCYERGLRRAPTLRGQVRVRFTIDPDGRVREASITSSPAGFDEVSACVLTELRTFVFPPRSTGSVTVNYPFNFTANVSSFDDG